MSGCFEFFYRDQFARFATVCTAAYLPAALPVLPSLRLQERLSALRVALHDPYRQTLQYQNHHFQLSAMSGWHVEDL